MLNDSVSPDIMHSLQDGTVRMNEEGDSLGSLPSCPETVSRTATGRVDRAS